ncbi:MAG: uncharacterized protein HW416_450 [Chloroflexi bacterium]|nr:uncharacterized protein [Chloroflexota bacterium]
MVPAVPVYLEIGRNRTFAGAIEWPGWCRSGRNEAEALATLVAYGPRYARAIDSEPHQFQAPEDVSSLQVVERLVGNSGTDFGAPSVPSTGDALPPNTVDGERLMSLLGAAWHAFDAASEAAAGLALRKGPRGGGREIDKMVQHVFEGDQAYLRELGGAPPKQTSDDVNRRLAAVRDAGIRTFLTRQAGLEPKPGPRRTRPFWSLRFFVRYSAWHALDHGWEVEDRAIPSIVHGPE